MAASPGGRMPAATWWFVGSRHGFTTARWGHEPKAPASRAHSKRFASLWNVETARQRLECVELAPAFGVRFMGSVQLQPSDAHWGFEPKVQNPWSAGVLTGVLQLENLAGKDAGAPRFIGKRRRETGTGQH